MPTGDLCWRTTDSGAELAFSDEVVIKRHSPRTRPDALERRLALAAAHPDFVPPVTAEVRTDPDGRAVTVWPRVRVLDPADSHVPWAEAGRLLARLHRSPAPDELPTHGWPDRLARARAAAPPELAALAERLGAEASRRPEPAVLVHGDWHLGQLGAWRDGWRLIDVDDVGLGDPAWDLARPAGFWAARLLGDADWLDFLDAYRAADGPAVPRGDPWPVLDLPARCAVLVAAVRALRSSEVHSDGTAHALVSACRRMAQ
ncbi:phosphotransferase family protein [Micropruina sp.]|uniref:phosphotransferase family protein n=1 Tax=Micropruina sp. TaxID=2737536 RepID=UPI0039E6AEA2